MIIVENITMNGKEFTYTYSDANRYVVRDGISYSEAYDPAEFGRTYIEGDVMSAEEIDSKNEEAEEIVNILTGVQGGNV